MFFGSSRDDALARAGSLAQLAGVEHATLDDGPGRGMRRLRVWTGGGLEADVLPDRAFDLGAVRVHGIPVAWIAPRGYIAPALDQDRAFVGAFAGGLLATCGLDTFGLPSRDGDDDLPQHGRIGRHPAEVIRTEVAEDRTVLEARVVQAVLGGEHLVLRRRIEFPHGSSEIGITDVVTNEGHAEQPHMLLYHANIGWPLLDEGVELMRGPGRTVGLRGMAHTEVARWDEIHGPVAGIDERVYLHHLGGDEATFSVVNRRIGLALDVAVDTATLPYLIEWKMLGRVAYVLGLEPSNTPVLDGRPQARAAGVLPVLSPGESRSYRVVFRFSRV